MNPKLKRRFQEAAKKITAAKAEPRFRRVLGKLKKAKFLNIPGIPEYGGPVDLKDVMWAGRIEPRVYEVLPALLLSRPKLLRIYEMPRDLEAVLTALKRGKPEMPFRGIPPKAIKRWVIRQPSKLKTFRLNEDDLKKLSELKDELKAESETQVLRQALEILQKTLRK